MICRINHSVRKFQRLHLYAERCIFGLRNRAVFTEFASFLNTAVEIVEEVTSRNCTHAQDVDFVKCYGIRATSKQEQQEQQQAADNGAWGGADGSCMGDYYGGSWDGSHDGYGGITVNNNHYDYYENADNVETDDADADADEEMASVGQMLADFDAMRALTAPTASVVVEDTVQVEVEKQQVVVIANDQEQTEEVELVMTATAVKEEQREEKEKETNKSSSNGDNDASQNKPKGKWFSWF